MRLLAYCLLVPGFCISLVGCGGDSSSTMSVWNDGGAGGAGGMTGAAGHGGSVGGSGGGSGGTMSAGTIAVTGGIRDLATAQCTVTTGGSCATSAAQLACLKSGCAASIDSCYVSDGVSAAVGGACKDYANCLLRCSCDAGKSACEKKCLDAHLTSDMTCLSCMSNLTVCASAHGCTITTACATNSGGS